MEDEKITPTRLVVFVLGYLLSLFVLAFLVFRLAVFRPEGPASMVSSPTAIQSESSARAGREKVKGTRPAARPGGASGPVRKITLRGPRPRWVVVSTRRGTFRIRLLWRGATGTAANFVTLAEKRFFDGTRFHFVGSREIVGGDPKTRNNDPGDDGTGGPGYTIPAEFNLRPNVAGTVGMVRGPDPNSAGSQFYIGLVPLPERNGRYAVFGQIDKGLDVLYKIRKGDNLISARIMR